MINIQQRSQNRWDMQHKFSSYESSDYATRYVNGRKVTRKPTAKKSVVISTDSEVEVKSWGSTRMVKPYLVN
jgi:hypothetical protein